MIVLNVFIEPLVHVVTIFMLLKQVEVQLKPLYLSYRLAGTQIDNEGHRKHGKYVFLLLLIESAHVKE